MVIAVVDIGTNVMKGANEIFARFRVRAGTRSCQGTHIGSCCCSCRCCSSIVGGIYIDVAEEKTATFCTVATVQGCGRTWVVAVVDV